MQIKGDKGQVLQNQHELLTRKESINYLRHFSRNKYQNFQSKKIQTLKKSLTSNFNKPFDVEEFKCVLRKLKQNKAPGIDSRTNEMLKCFNYNPLIVLKNILVLY